MTTVRLRFPAPDDAMVSPALVLSNLPAPLKVEGKQVGEVRRLAEVAEDGRSYVVEADLWPEHEGFVGAVELGLLEGVKLADPPAPGPLERGIREIGALETLAGIIDDEKDAGE